MYYQVESVQIKVLCIQNYLIAKISLLNNLYYKFKQFRKKKFLSKASVF